MAGFNGLDLNMGNLYRLSEAKTRSISPENFTGEPGRGGMALEGTGAAAARDLGQGWKISPSIRIDPGETRILADIERVNPLPYAQVYTILDGIHGKGQYVGTYMAWGCHNT